MALRRIIYQISIWAGVATFLITIWQAMARWGVNLLQASLHAMLAALAVIVVSLMISGIIIRLGNSE